MKYTLEIHALARMQQSAEKKHENAIALMKQLPPPWAIDPLKEIKFPGFGKEDVLAVVDLNKLLGKQVKGSIQYIFRNMLTDTSKDFLELTFNTDKIDYSVLVNEVFPKLVHGFDAYQAQIYPDELYALDFNDPERRVNFRQKLGRIYPVKFFDEVICQRALDKTPAEVVELLKGVGEKVGVFNKGVLIIASSKPLNIEESNEFDNVVRSKLSL